MKTLRSASLAGLVLLGALVGGCASVPMASVEEDRGAKTFAVPEDKSGIYVYRSEIIGGAVPLTVTLDGRVVGQTAARTYFVVVVDPGTHELGSIGENTSSLTLTTEAGKAYFVWQAIRMGLWMARSELQQVDEEAGRKAVAACSRAQSRF